MAARICLCALVALLWGCERQPTRPGGSDAAGEPTEAGLRIAVIPKGTTHDFWKSVHAGALKAERELANAEIIFRGPEKEDDREQQISLVQNFISSRVDAIVLLSLIHI